MQGDFVVHGAQRILVSEDVQVREDERTRVQRREVSRAKTRRRSEDGEDEGEVQAKALDDEDYDHGSVLDVHPPAHGAAGVVGVQGRESLAFLLYSAGFTA